MANETKVRERDHDINPKVHGDDPRYATPVEAHGRGYHGLYDSPRLGNARVAGERAMGGPSGAHYRRIINSQTTRKTRGR